MEENIKYNIIQHVTDLGYCKLIEETVDYLNNIVDEAKKVFEHRTMGYELSREDISICQFFLRSIQIVDGVASLIEGGSINEIGSQARRLFELYLYISYIFRDNELAIEKIRAWELYQIEDRLRQTQKFNIQNKRYEEYQRRIPPNILNAFDQEKLVKQERHCQEMKRKKKYSKILKLRNIKIKENSGKYLQWYSIHSKAINLKELSEELGLESYYTILYDCFSRPIHHFDITKSTIFKEDSVNFLYPSIPQDVMEITNQISLILTFQTRINQMYLDYYNLSDIKLNYYRIHLKLRQQGEYLEKKWKKISL